MRRCCGKTPVRCLLLVVLKDLHPTDNDGLPDHVEDVNQNGVVDFGETDPGNPDTDDDGLFDGIEDANHNGIVDISESDPTDCNDPCSTIDYFVVIPNLSYLASTDTDRLAFFDTSHSLCFEMVSCIKESCVCTDEWDFGGAGNIVGGNSDNIISYQYDSSGDYTASLTMTEQDSDTTTTNNLTVTAEIVQTPIPFIDFDTSIDTATVSVTITDPDSSDADVESIIIFWGDRYRSEYNGSLPAIIDHTYTRTDTDYHIRVKTVITGGKAFNYTFTNDEDLTVSIP